MNLRDVHLILWTTAVAATALAVLVVSVDHRRTARGEEGEP